MLKMTKNKIFFLFFTIAVCLPAIAYAANYPLQIVRPESGLGTNDRIYRAYPGIEYEIQVAVRGGVYPFTYSLSNAPQGMQIDSSTGVILWPNPQEDSDTITVSVTDAEGKTDRASWSIRVTTNGFYFVNAAAPDGGNGSLSAPWNQWSDFYLGQSDSTYQDGIIYFYNGTYTYPSAYTNGTAGSSNRLWIENHPKAYLAYPGQNAVIFDGERTSNRIHLHTLENNLYFKGINFRNGYGFFVEINGGNYHRFLNCSFDTYTGSGSSSNQAAISFRSDAPNNGDEPPDSNAGFSSYPVVQNCSFSNAEDNETGIKTYGLKYAVFSGNTFSNINGFGISLKSTTDQSTVRENKFNGIDGIIILAQYYAHNSDISFNYINNPGGVAVQVGTYTGSMGPGPTHIYRNTIIGSFWCRHIDSSDDGPINIYKNIIINNDNHSNTTPHIRENVGEHYSITSARSFAEDNLTGSTSDGIIDSNGQLQEPYKTEFLGSHGYEFSVDFQEAPLPPPYGIQVLK